MTEPPLTPNSTPGLDCTLNSDMPSSGIRAFRRLGNLPGLQFEIRLRHQGYRNFRCACGRLEAFNAHCNGVLSWRQFHNAVETGIRAFGRACFASADILRSYRGVFDYGAGAVLHGAADVARDLLGE